MILILYLIDFLEKVSIFCGVGLFLSALTILIAILAMTESKYGIWNYIKNKWLFPLLLGITLVLIPSKTTMYLMASTKFMQSIVLNEKTMSIGNQTLKILEKKLDELLKDSKN